MWRVAAVAVGNFDVVVVFAAAFVDAVVVVRS